MYLASSNNKGQTSSTVSPQMATVRKVQGPERAKNRVETVPVERFAGPSGPSLQTTRTGGGNCRGGAESRGMVESGSEFTGVRGAVALTHVLLVPLRVCGELFRTPPTPPKGKTIHTVQDSIKGEGRGGGDDQICLFRRRGTEWTFRTHGSKVKLYTLESMMMLGGLGARGTDAGVPTTHPRRTIHTTLPKRGGGGRGGEEVAPYVHRPLPA